MPQVYANLAVSGGQDLSLRIINPSTGQIVITVDLAELENGTFSANVPSFSIVYRADVIDEDGDTIATDWVYPNSQVIGIYAEEEQEIPTYYTTVRRNSGDESPIFFQWYTDGASLTVTKSLNGEAYQPLSGTASYLREESADLFVYQIEYNEDDRPNVGTVSYKVTDGTKTHIIPVTIDSGSINLVGLGSIEAPLIIESTNGERIDGVAVWVTQDLAGDKVVAGTLYTDGQGLVTFWLDEGTYYVWKQLNGYNFNNPDQITVTEPNS